jgi:hypothetical protein
MEIYTGDFISIAQEYADKIKKELKSENYIIEDVCCDLQMKIRRLIYKRLSEQFKEIIKDDLVYIENREYLYNKLTKTINEL